MSELNIPGFIAFLRGEVTIDGHWFGGDGPIRGGIRRNFWWREHLPKLSSHIERQDAEIAQLRADLSESRRLLDEAREQVPVGVVEHWNIGGSGERKTVHMYLDMPDGTKLYAAAPPADASLTDGINEFLTRVQNYATEDAVREFPMTAIAHINGLIGIIRKQAAALRALSQPATVAQVPEGFVRVAWQRISDAGTPLPIFITLRENLSAHCKYREVLAAAPSAKGGE